MNGYGNNTSQFGLISCHTIYIAQTGSNFEVSGYTLINSEIILSYGTVYFARPFGFFGVSLYFNFFGVS